jgi:hypothetical protein
LNCVILVHRFTTRWVLSAIFPIMATTWLGFLVFFLPRDDMNGRLGEPPLMAWAPGDVHSMNIMALTS